MSRKTLQFWIAGAVIAFLALCFAQPSAAQATINVNTTQQGVTTGQCSLQEAIYASEFQSNTAVLTTDPNATYTTGCTAGRGKGDTIVLPAGLVFLFDQFWNQDANNTFGATATPVIFSNITIEGNGSTLEWVGTGNSRLFAVGTGSLATPTGATISGTGSLFLENVYVKGFHAKGGDGGFCGGGGGLGAGGAIYVQNGSVGIQGSTFDSNAATGGNGGSCFGGEGGGGGGGLSGNGGAGFGGLGFVGGGGGGGSLSNGGKSASLITQEGGGGGGGSVNPGNDGFNDEFLQNAYGGYGGSYCGARGGNGASDGNSATCPGGGGGGSGGSQGLMPFYFGSTGGSGAYGGGGGGASGTGGNGGFGGGGGGGVEGSGGYGGFGGGGGGYSGCLISCSAGHGGPFGGNGSSNQGGGGGGALGGAIFVDNGTLSVFNSTFYKNSVSRGAGAGADNGGDSGGAIFVRDGSLTMDDVTISNNQATGAGGGLVIYADGPETTFILYNTIIANNGANACFFTNGSGPLNNVPIGAGNLIMDNGTGTGPFTPCPGVVATTDPQLFPLALNAPGNTPTMAILMSSSAAGTADAGTSFDRDQRGVVRPQSDGYDIGAYEARSPNFSMGPVATLPVSLGGTNTTTVTVSSFEYFNAPVTLGVTTPPNGVSVSFSPNPVTPPYNGSVSSTMTVTLAPFVTPGSYTPTITGTSGALSNSAPATISVPAATTSSITNVIGQLFSAGCIDNSGIVYALTTNLAAAQAEISQGNIQTAINGLNAVENELRAQGGKHIAGSCTIGGVTFSPNTALLTDVQSLIISLQ